MSDIPIHYEQTYYCAICDRYFISAELRDDHVQCSTNHPKCEDCDRRFPNMNAMRNVCRLSSSLIMSSLLTCLCL